MSCQSPCILCCAPCWEAVTFFFFFFFVFFFLGCTRGIWRLRLGVQSELQLLAYTTATAMPDPNRICHLHHSSWQYQIFNPLSEARDHIHNIMVPS